MHRTAGSGDGKAAGPLSSLSTAHSIAVSAPQETSPLNHQEQSWKPSKETLHYPANSHFHSPKVSDKDWDTSHTK